MKKILLICLLICNQICYGLTPPDTIHWDLNYNSLVKNNNTENINNGVTCIVGGLLLTSVGVVKEITRKPYPTHPNDVHPTPDAPMILNYMLIGGGLGFTGYGVRLIFKF